MWMPKPQGRVIKNKTEWLLFRPDLERKHRNHVERKLAEEAWAKAEERDGVVMFRQHQLARMRRRRQQNKAAATRRHSTYHPSNTAKRAHQVLSRSNGVRVKDWTFYRRRGAIWTDLAHTPADRVHLVVTPAVLEGEERAARHIHQCIDQEQAVKEAVDETRFQRAEEQRQLFRERKAEREAVLAATISKPVTPSVARQTGRYRNLKAAAKKSGWKPSTSLPRSRPRTRMLARPRSYHGPEEFGTADFRGLLLADDTTRIMAVSAAAMQGLPQRSQRSRMRSTRQSTRRPDGGGSEVRSGAGTGGGAVADDELRTPSARSTRRGRPSSAPPRKAAARSAYGGSATVERSSRLAATYQAGMDRGGGIANNNNNTARINKSRHRQTRSLPNTPRGAATAPLVRNTPTRGPTPASGAPTTMSVRMDPAVAVISSTVHTMTNTSHGAPPPRNSTPFAPSSPRPHAPTTPASASSRQRRRMSIRSTGSAVSRREAAAAEAAPASTHRDLRSFDRRIASESTFHHKGPHKFSRQTKAEMEKTSFDDSLQPL